MLRELRTPLVAPGVFVVDMDLLSFGTLCEVLVEVQNAEKTEAAWTAIRAAQGDLKGMKEWIAARWAPPKQDTSDLSAFLGAFKPDAVK